MIGTIGKKCAPDANQSAPKSTASATKTTARWRTKRRTCACASGVSARACRPPSGRSVVSGPSSSR